MAEFVSDANAAEVNTESGLFHRKQSAFYLIHADGADFSFQFLPPASGPIVCNLICWTDWDT